MLSKSFYEKLSGMCGRLGMNPRDLLLVMTLESGINPASKNPHGGAAGLIQFMPATLRGMGVKPNDIKNFNKKSGEEQLDYVEKYIKGNQALIGGRPFSSATQYYHANFFPATLKRWRGNDPVANANVVVAAKDAKSSQERAAYDWNKGLDSNKDGTITVGDLTKILMGVSKRKEFQEALKNINSIDGEGAVSELSSKTNKEKMKPKSKQNVNLFSFISNLNNIVNNFLKAASIDTTKIKLNSNSDFSSKLEYSKILQSAIKEELNIESDIYINNEDIELKLSSYSYDEKYSNAIKELCNAISDTFEYATRKIGGIKVVASIDSDSITNYQKLDIKTSDINYRKFRLKFSSRNI